MWWHSRAWLGFLGALALTLLSAPAAASAARSWTLEKPPLDQLGHPLSSVVCPSTTQCLAAGERVVTFDPASPDAAGVFPSELGFPVCPAADECVSARPGGRVSRFDPRSPGSTTTTTTISDEELTLLDCPTTHACVARDAAGGFLNFDPLSPGPTTPQDIELPGGLAIHCPATDECVGFDIDGNEWTFDPGSPSTPTPVRIDTLSPDVTASACPAADTCVLVDGENNAFAFDPAAPDTTHHVTLGNDELGARVLACASAQQCVAVDEGGHGATFDPRGAVTGGAHFAPNLGIRALTCPSTGLCVAVDDKGRETAFNPTAFSTPTPATIDADAMTGVDCPSVRLCVAVEDRGSTVSLNPSGSGVPVPAVLDDGGGLTGVACPAVGLCVAVGSQGQALMYDPASPAGRTRLVIDPGHPHLTGVACPSTGACVAVDDDGGAVPFEPSAGDAAPRAAIDERPLSDVACASVSRCVAVDGGGFEVAFDPAAPGTPTPVGVDLGQALTAVACPVSTECVAVDDAGGRVAFDPALPGSPSAVPIGGGGHPVDLACSSASVCVAVDREGRAAEGDPNDPAPWAVTPLAGDRGLAAVACHLSSECVAVASLGTAYVGTGPGEPLVVTGPTVSDQQPEQADPITGGRGTWTNAPTSYDDQWLRCDGAGLGCQPIPGADAPAYTPTSADIGHTLRIEETARNAVGASDPAMSKPTKAVHGGPPVARAAPTIVGSAAQGRTLLEGHGSWVYGPTAYAYQWQRCDTDAAHCAPISGATQRSYRLVAADVGHRIRVSEAGRNDVGTGNPELSKPTNLVQGVPVAGAPPSISGTAARGRTLTEQHGTWAPAATGYSYRWVRCDTGGGACGAIAGADSPTYALGPADVGHRIRVEETASNAVGGGLPATSALTDTVRGVPVSTAPPTISGVAARRRRLTDLHGLWSWDPATYRYQWTRCDAGGRGCVPIGGATGQIYNLREADVGHRIRVAESAINEVGAGAAATSAPSDRVTGGSSTSGDARRLRRKVRSALTRLKHGRTRLHRASLDLPAIKRGGLPRGTIVRLSLRSNAKALGHARVKVRAGDTRIAVRLSRRCRRLLRHHHRVRARLRITVDPPGAEPSGTTRRIALER